MPVTDRTLFDPDRTMTAKCPVCGELREPGEDKTRHCVYEYDRDVGIYRPRPVGCLNAHDPVHAPFPEGF
jgi:hypothetical protein